MTYNLFLDDIRDPNWVYHKDSDWVICRSYDDAVNCVKKNGFPKMVSFDHDLGEDQTGFDFAKFLVEIDLDTLTMPSDFYYKVHSSNEPGRDNIAGLLDSYMKHKSEIKDGRDA
jgi:hypothetical protein